MKSYYNIKTKQEVVLFGEEVAGLVCVISSEDWKSLADLQKGNEAYAILPFLLSKHQTYCKAEFKQLFVEKTILSKALYGYQ